MAEFIQLKSFDQLDSWKKAHAAALKIYKLSGAFPDHEHYGLSSQMRRAAVSVTSNIAEGFNRLSVRSKIHFYSMSQGSVAELQAQLLIAKDLGYCEMEDFHEIMNELIDVHRLLTGLIKSCRRRLN